MSVIDELREALEAARNEIGEQRQSEFSSYECDGEVQGDYEKQRISELDALLSRIDAALSRSMTGVGRPKVSQEAMDWAAEQVAAGVLDHRGGRPFSEFRAEVISRREWVLAAATEIREATAGTKLAAEEIALIIGRHLPTAGGVPDGFKLVPLEPDNAMKLAGGNTFDGIGNKDAETIYRRMLAAAPSPEAEG